MGWGWDFQSQFGCPEAFEACRILVTGFQGAMKCHQFDSWSNIKRPPMGVNKWMLVGTQHLARGSEMPTQPCNERNCWESNVKLVIKLSGLVTLQTSGHLRARSQGYLYSLHLQTPCDCCNDGIKSSPVCGISVLSFWKRKEGGVQGVASPLGRLEEFFCWRFMMRFGVGVRRKEFLICTKRDNLDEETSAHL